MFFLYNCVNANLFRCLTYQSSRDQALELLQRLCSNDLDVPVGHIVHTGMLNERGGYENDCSVVRLSKNRFVTQPGVCTSRSRLVCLRARTFGCVVYF